MTRGEIGMWGEVGSLRLGVELVLKGKHLEICARSALGEASGVSQLPDPTIPNWMMENCSRPIPTSKLEAIGRQLYQAVLPGEVGRLGQELFQAAMQQKQAVYLELQFAAGQTFLSEYPWELITDESGGFLVRSGIVDLVRAISFPQPPPVFGSQRLSLPVLMAVSKPCRLPPIQSMEMPFGQIHLLEHSSFDGLREMITQHGEDYSALQFYGHSGVALLCSQCGEVNSIRREQCCKCEGTLTQARDVCALAFEEPDGRVVWAPVTRFGEIIASANFSYVLLLTCKAARIADHLVFGSISPSLILSGVPLVIGLQYPVRDEAASFFAIGFYQGMRDDNDLLGAVREARRLHLHKDWYSPAIFIRRLQPDAAPEIPRRLYSNRYLFLQPMIQQPEGGLYLAYDLVLNQKCQVLVYRKCLEEFAGKFPAHVQAVANGVGRPGLRLLDFFRLDEQCFVVMDYEPDPDVLDRLLQFLVEKG